MRHLKINLAVLFSILITLPLVVNAQERKTPFTVSHSLLNMYKSENYLGVNHKLVHLTKQQLTHIQQQRQRMSFLR